MAIESIVEQLVKEPLDVNCVHPDPIHQFHEWYTSALRAEVLQPDAMHLSTVAVDGTPSGRLVIYKDPEQFGLNLTGFPFFTNYNSPKAKEMTENPSAAATFYWIELGRQIRLEGTAEKVSEAISDGYFAQRPEGSKLGAWASPQSSIMESRGKLVEEVERYRRKFHGKAISRPPSWGGFVIKPIRMEFWQHRDDRLHDRVLYQLQGDQRWIIQQLAP